MTTTRAAVLLSLLSSACLLAACQSSQPAQPAQTAPATPAAQPPAAHDAQSTLEPRSEPGEGQKLLARMAGKWDVVKTFYPRGGGQPAVSRGECTQHMIHGGRFLQSDFVFHEGGNTGDTTGTGVIGFDPQTGKFTSFWSDSRSTRFSIRQSESTFDGQTIILFARNLGDPGPSARRSRTVSVLEDSDRRLIHRQYTDTPGEEPRLVMQLEMTRHP
jgi:hypothetical protein